MSQPLRDHTPGELEPVPAPDDVRERARERAEAEAAVRAVMEREAERESHRLQAEAQHVRRPFPIRLVLLLVLMAFNVQLWFGQNEWLQFHQPDALAMDYYASSYKVAVYLQRQRIEEYRRDTGVVPKTARQAGTPVKGVRYTPLAPTTYQLSAGDGANQYVYTSTDSLRLAFGRALLRIAIAQGGGR